MKASFFGYAASVIFTYPNIIGLHFEQVQDGWQITASFGDNGIAHILIIDDAWEASDWHELIKPLSKEIYETQGLEYE